MKTSTLTKHQKKSFVKLIDVDGKKGRIVCDIRYDDECGNGHNSFSITGTVYSSETSKSDRYFETGGCIHEEIEKHFPEFKHLIKWHLMDSDAPMHYIANTIYHAKESLKYNFFIDSKNKQVKRLHIFNVNEDFLMKHTKYKEQLQKIFNDYNLSMNYQDYRKSNNIDKRGLYKEYDLYNYCLELENFLLLNNEKDISIYKVAKERGSDYKETNLKAARNCAIWEDATLEQLQDEDLLKSRLPQLRKDFIKDIEALGFIY